MIIYDSAAIYIEKASDLKDKIARYDAIINALELATIKAAETGNITEYSLDDGQTKIKTTYRDATQIAQSIMAFIRLKQMAVNDLNGRKMRLVDAKNFIQH
jgi:hypothetical protein